MPTDTVQIQPLARPPDADVIVPGSKSYTNRALLVSAMASGTSRLSGALFSDDTRYMSETLRQLGVNVVADEAAARFTVTGTGGIIPVSGAELYVGNSGTTCRSIISYVAHGRGRFVIDGDAPMRQTRPISDLLDALTQLGVDARSQNDNGCLPVVIQADGFAGGRTRLDASKSSQFLTALMLTGPGTAAGLEIEMTGDLKTGYIDITMDVMRAFNAEVTHDDYRSFAVPGGQRYAARNYAIEPDASSASYFFAAAALSGGRIRVGNLGVDSVQADLGFIEVLEQMGCHVTRSASSIEVIGPRSLAGVDVDMRPMSDTFLTLAAIAPFADAPVAIRNIEHTRWQETDRIHAAVTELRRLGVRVDERQDGLTVFPSPVTPASVHTYEDHRVAMALALIGLRAPGVEIQNPGCVSKTFPTYFSVLDSIRR